MEEPQFSDSIAERTDMPEALNDPGEPVQPDIDEENATPNAPMAEPYQDMEATENAPGTVQEDKGDISDAESELSDVDEARIAEFEDFDAANIDIADRPAVAIDESNVGLLGVHKRKRAEGDGGAGRKKKKESRREKPKKSRKRRGEGDEGAEFDGGEGGERRTRKKPERKQKVQVEEDWSTLDPRERRKRELDAKLDAALKTTSTRRSKQSGIDLEAAADAEVEDMRVRMTKAAQADNEGRQNGQPAQYKLKLLPEVVSLLNRNTLQNSIIDPETNLLEAVRFFLEPLSDGSLPAYNIQREIFTALSKLPITKEALISSSIGKVVLFYTKSKRPEPGIKRMADKLIGDWTRPILKRTDDYRKKEFQEAKYDPMNLPVRSSTQGPSQNGSVRGPTGLTSSSRARPMGGSTQSYSVVPKSNPIIANPEDRPGAPLRSELAKQLRLGKPGRR